MHVSLTPKLEQVVKHKVASGLYNNASEVIRDALRRMEQYDDSLYLTKLSHLLNAVEQGAIQAENQELIEQSVESLILESKQKKYGMCRSSVNHNLKVHQKRAE